jgi:hypothetical protein
MWPGDLAQREPPYIPELTVFRSQPEAAVERLREDAETENR